MDWDVQMENYNSQTESEDYSPKARAAARNQLADDVEQFLKTGGKVAEIPRGERADPPRKPENNYGRGSI